LKVALMSRGRRVSACGHELQYVDVAFGLEEASAMACSLSA
jgi:hypothetical protein